MFHNRLKLNGTSKAHWEASILPSFRSPHRRLMKYVPPWLTCNHTLRRALSGSSLQKVLECRVLRRLHFFFVHKKRRLNGIQADFAETKSLKTKSRRRPVPSRECQEIKSAPSLERSINGRNPRSLSEHQRLLHHSLMSLSGHRFLLSDNILFSREGESWRSCPGKDDKHVWDITCLAAGCSSTMK